MFVMNPLMIPLLLIPFLANAKGILPSIYPVCPRSWSDPEYAAFVRQDTIWPISLPKMGWNWFINERQRETSWNIL
jgi:hypothetical protein